jgi:hypothetical protein
MPGSTIGETQMNIDDVKELKKATEVELMLLISRKLQEFEAITGMGIDGIYVDFVETTAVFDTQRRYALGSVKLNIVMPWE